MRWASNIDEFKLKVQGISTTAEMARDEMAKRAASSRTSSGLAAEPAVRSAYVDALHLLSRRALSVAECRDRLLDARARRPTRSTQPIARSPRDRRPRRQAPRAGIRAHRGRDQGPRTPARRARAPGPGRRQGGRGRSRRRGLRREGRAGARRPGAAEEAAARGSGPPTPPRGAPLSIPDAPGIHARRRHGIAPQAADGRTDDEVE